MRRMCSLRTVVRIFHDLQERQGSLNVSLTAAILQEEETPEVPEERKAIFYAAAELAV